MKIFITILFILILAAFFIYTLKQEIRIKEQSEQIEKLVFENDSLLKANVLLDNSITNWKEKSDSLDKKISINDSTITKLRKQKHEKTGLIDTMDHVKLFEFFSEFKTESQTD